MPRLGAERPPRRAAPQTRGRAGCPSEPRHRQVRPSRQGGRNAEKRPLRAERPVLPRPGAAVLSARWGLTAEFGMGSGVPSSLWLPKNFQNIIDREGRSFLQKQDARAISTGQLHASRRFHLQPIDEVVYLGPSGLASGRTYLKAGFPLRCFQRLSLPHIATLLCRWHDNRSTRGASIPVLSY